MTTDRPVAIVTGVSSGIGRATAVLLAQRGYWVFGSGRQADGSTALPNIELAQLDVRDDRAVADFVEHVRARAGRIDVLVNNAGYAVAGAAEEMSITQVHAQFETNFFGAIRMIRAVLPSMRLRETGRIVNISSVVGLVPVPFLSVYAASKHALEGYSEALDHEVRPFGIRVSLVEPGFTSTKLGANLEQADTPLDAYAARRARLIALVGREIAGGLDPGIVADAVLQAVTSSSPRLRYVVGREARLLSRLRRFLPATAFDRGLRRQFQLDAALQAS
jgi:NAD(P)-dependent dehydrogenase (short-subunit alcohol dehydrogenase family)